MHCLKKLLIVNPYQMAKSFSLSFFLSFLALVVAFFPELSFAASTIEEVFNEGTNTANSVYNGIKQTLRVICAIGLIFLLWRYMKDKLEWDAFIKYGFSLLAIGLAPDIVGIFIK